MKLKALAAGLTLLATTQPALANIDIVFDYSYDTNLFFSDASRRSVLDAAASVFETSFGDQLTAISSSKPNSFNTSFFNPADPNGADINIIGDSIGADVIRVYAGGYNFSGGTLGTGGPGGYSCSGIGSFCNNAIQRGQGVVTGAGAVDVAPWGGSITFDTDTNWYFGVTTGGLNSSQYDFYSVAVHELAHLLGFGTSDSFYNLVSGTNFVGATTGTVALAGDLGHWASGTVSTFEGISQEAAMTPSIANGTRKNFTDLDFAAMQDIGWQVTPVPEADTWAMLLAGLGLVGFASRRRLV